MERRHSFIDLFRLGSFSFPALSIHAIYLGLFARKLLMSEKEKETRRMEKKKAKEQRKKK